MHNGAGLAPISGEGLEVSGDPGTALVVALRGLLLVPCLFCCVKYTCQGNHFWRSFTYLMVKLVAFGATPNLAASHCVVCLIE